MGARLKALLVMVGVVIVCGILIMAIINKWFLVIIVFAGFLLASIVDLLHDFLFEYFENN